MRTLILIGSLIVLAFGMTQMAQAGTSCVTNCSNTSDGRSQNCQTWCH